MAGIITNLPYDLQLEVFKRTNYDDLTSLLIATVKHSKLKIRAAEEPENPEYEVKLSKLKILINRCLDRLLKTESSIKSEEERISHYAKMSSPLGRWKQGDGEFLTLKIVFQLIELLEFDSGFLSPEQFDILKKSSILDFFHGFKLQDQFWELLRAAAAAQIQFIRIEYENPNGKPVYFVIPTISSNDKIISLVENNNLQVEFSVFGSLVLRHLKRDPDFTPKFADFFVKANEFYKPDDVHLIEKYLKCYNGPTGSVPHLAVRHIHSGHILNDDVPTNKYRPEFYWSGFMKDGKQLHEDILDNFWNNAKMHLTFFGNCFLHRRECIWAAIQLE